jgi:hypothetical protein
VPTVKRFLCPMCDEPPKRRTFAAKHCGRRMQRFRCEPCARWYRRGELVDSFARGNAAELSASESRAFDAFFADPAIIEALTGLHQAADDARYRRLGLEPAAPIFTEEPTA